MSKQRYQAEFRNGLGGEAKAAIAVLQERWPSAFPEQPDLVRPLIGSLIAPISQGTGWSKRYTASVLVVWKTQDAYCQAVLRHNHRYDLTGEEVTDKQRALAAERLASRVSAQVRNVTRRAK